MLARRVGDLEVTCGALQAKNTSLAAELQQLRSIVDMMSTDASALVAQVGELGGTVAPDILTNLNWLAAARATAGWGAVQAAGGAEAGAEGGAEQAA